MSLFIHHSSFIIHHSFSVYVHIPFCRSICSYCDFLRIPHESHSAHRYVEDLVQEITTVPDEMFPSNQCCTIFFGGGTPSILSPENLDAILSAIRSRCTINPAAEITIECNPGTVDAVRLSHLRKAGFNRASFGVQSFDADTLRRLSRVHSPEEARAAVRDARSAGFDSVSLDMIFGLPDQTPARWRSDLDEAVRLQPDHISLYSLMLDGNTVMRREVEAGSLTLPDDDVVGDMFGMGIDALNAAGLRQYEISNFARPGRECRHNRQYWDGGPYIGFGVGAHSFDGQKRWWNVKSLDVYHERVAAGASPVAESEALDEQQRMEEFVMLQLRLAEGLDLEQISGMLPEVRLQAFHGQVKALPDGLLDISENRLRLTRQGFLVADRIILELVNAIGETP